MITLSSDFGMPYPAAMKGVLCQQTTARLIDISHGFPRHDIRTAAFWLREILPFFPPAVHLVVVDPGVGTDRAALVIRAGEHTLVGPDNGVLIPAANRLSDGEITGYEIDDTDAASATFHGRDVFAPTAAAVHDHDGPLETLERLRPLEANEWVALELPTPTIGDDVATGTVLVVDEFGNVITNLPGAVLIDQQSILVNGEPYPVGETFASVPPGEPLVTVGSHGYVELDVNQGRGDERFDLRPGDSVRLEQNGER